MCRHTRLVADTFIAVSPGSRLPSLPLPSSNRVYACVVFSRRLGYHRSARSTTFKGPINEYSSHDGSNARCS